MPNEIVIEKKGILGRVKLAFNFLDRRLQNGISNMDSIVVKYRKSGEYESYNDFKES
jgi:hypothetical protein